MKHKQKETFFMVLSIGNLDNTVEPDDESPDTHHTIDKAINKAKEITEEYGLRTYVYKCVPVIKIGRGKTIITKLREVKCKTGK